MKRLFLIMLASLTACSRAPAPELDAAPATDAMSDATVAPDAEHQGANDGSMFPQVPVLSTYTTVFHPIDGRTRNIELAAQALEGHVIFSGDVFSFNDVVGIRSPKRGYVDAPVIVDGRKKPDTGGGVCQVSSTFHAAALLGRLKVVERRPHTLVPKYIEPGFDATVTYPASCEVTGMPCGKIDLKVKNTYEVALIVHTSIEDEGRDKRLTVEIRGVHPEVCVHTLKYSKASLGFGTHRMVRSMGLQPTQAFKVQEAGEGTMVWSTLVWQCENKSDAELKWFSRYPPIDEVWEVGYRRPTELGEPWSM